MEGRQYLGFELNEDYVAIARARLEDVGHQSKMFAT
jgi:hypothetical protein